MAQGADGLSGAVVPVQQAAVQAAAVQLQISASQARQEAAQQLADRDRIIANLRTERTFLARRARFAEEEFQQSQKGKVLSHARGSKIVQKLEDREELRKMLAVAESQQLEVAQLQKQLDGVSSARVDETQRLEAQISELEEHLTKAKQELHEAEAQTLQLHPRSDVVDAKSSNLPSRSSSLNSQSHKLGQVHELPSSVTPDSKEISMDSDRTQRLNASTLLRVLEPLPFREEAQEYSARWEEMLWRVGNFAHAAGKGKAAAEAVMNRLERCLPPYDKSWTEALKTCQRRFVEHCSEVIADGQLSSSLLTPIIELAEALGETAPLFQALEAEHATAQDRVVRLRDLYNAMVIHGEALTAEVANLREQSSKELQKSLEAQREAHGQTRARLQAAEREVVELSEENAKLRQARQQLLTQARKSRLARAHTAPSFQDQALSSPRMPLSPQAWLASQAPAAQQNLPPSSLSEASDDDDDLDEADDVDLGPLERGAAWVLALPTNLDPMAASISASFAHLSALVRQGVDQGLLGEPPKMPSSPPLNASPYVGLPWVASTVEEWIAKQLRPQDGSQHPLATSLKDASGNLKTLVMLSGGSALVQQPVARASSRQSRAQVKQIVNASKCSDFDSDSQASSLSRRMSSRGLINESQSLRQWSGGQQPVGQIVDQQRTPVSMGHGIGQSIDQQRNSVAPSLDEQRNSLSVGQIIDQQGNSFFGWQPRTSIFTVL